MKNIKLAKKIIITGDAGRGKTTFAKKLSDKLRIPLYSTDNFYYVKKFSVLRDRQESIKSISRLYEEKDKWTVEGTTRHLIEPGLDDADIIFYLYFKNIFYQLFTLIKRAIKRRKDPETDETIKGVLLLLKHTIFKRYGLGYKLGKQNHKGILSSHKDRVVEVNSFKELNSLLKSI